MRINLQPAIIKTIARNRLMVTGFSLLLPKYDPTTPPIITAIPRGKISDGMFSVERKFPNKPEIEFNKINSAETAAAFFVVAQRISKSNGVRKIPPPVPVSPDNNPRKAPTPIATGFDGSLGVSSFNCGMRKGMAEKSKIAPTIILKICDGKFK